MKQALKNYKNSKNREKKFGKNKKETEVKNRETLNSETDYVLSSSKAKKSKFGTIPTETPVYNTEYEDNINIYTQENDINQNYVKLKPKSEIPLISNNEIE